MIIKLTILFSFLSSILFSQEVQVFQANQEKDAAFFDFEDYEAPDKPIGELVFMKGCSWYCGGSVTSIKASSELNENNGISYSAKNAHDFDKNTAWVEGISDYGIGEFIEYHFDFSKMEDYEGTLGINKILLANGYKKSKLAWENNSRVKQFKVYLNAEPYAIINLLDAYEMQTIEFTEIKFPKNEETTLKFEITEVYEGKKYKDTAISLLMFDGIGVH